MNVGALMPSGGGRAQTLRASIPASGSPTARDAAARARGAGITSRESQIADRLFLSVRTVESHVRSILAKLHLTTRTEIAVWLRES